MLDSIKELLGMGPKADIERALEDGDLDRAEELAAEAGEGDHLEEKAKEKAIIAMGASRRDLAERLVERFDLTDLEDDVAEMRERAPDETLDEQLAEDEDENA